MDVKKLNVHLAGLMNHIDVQVSMANACFAGLVMHLIHFASKSKLNIFKSQSLAN